MEIDYDVERWSEMSEKDYVLGTHDEELLRLGLQHRVWRPVVLDCWQKAGITAGKRILDLGAGPGYAALDLAEIVGPSGEVVALERSGNFVTAMRESFRRRGLNNAKIYELDLMMGDLPQGLSMLRPLAITGVISVAVPTSASTRTFTANEETGSRELESERHPNVLQYGFAVEYSFIYLQQQVKDIGLRAPFDHLIPLVELGFETPLDRGQRGQTTGTINPGMIWSGKYFQAGAEAVIPMNSRTGSEVGFVAQLHFYLDDLFPHTIGRPLLGRK